MVIDNIVLFVGIVNFMLTLFVFFNAKELKKQKSFLVFSFIATLWLGDNFLLRLYPYSIFTPLSYGLGILVATAALLWVYNIVEEKIPKFILYFIIPFSIVVFFVSSFTNYIESSFGVLGSFGSAGAKKGILFPEYSLYLGFFIIVCLYKLGKKSIEEQDIFKKKQISSIFIGSLIFGLSNFTLGFLIPLFFNSFEVVDLATLAYLFLLVFISYSITKHRLFGIKIIITQSFIAIFLSLLLLNFLFSHSLNEYIWSGVILLASAVLSYLMTKSIFNEIKINSQLLEETQKNLDLEKRLRKNFAEVSAKVIKKIEDSILN